MTENITLIAIGSIVFPIIFLTIDNIIWNRKTKKLEKQLSKTDNKNKNLKESVKNILNQNKNVE